LLFSYEFFRPFVFIGVGLSSLDWLMSEVGVDQAEHEAFDVLDQVPEDC